MGTALTPPPRQSTLFRDVWNETRRLIAHGRVPPPYRNKKVFDVSLLVGRTDVDPKGARFPPKLLRALTPLSRELRPMFDSLLIMNPSQLHATVFGLYSSRPPSFPSRYGKNKRLRDYERLVAEWKKTRPFSVLWKGLNLTPQGTVLVEGHVPDSSLATLRQRLQKSIPSANGPQGPFFHISLGRLRRPVSLEQFQRLAGWVAQRRNKVLGRHQAAHVLLVATRDHAGRLVHVKGQKELKPYNLRLQKKSA